jgi:putative ABC transport system permease protein
MMLLKIASRNILRNRRRSFMTGSAIAVGAAAMLVFGGFISYIFAGLETGLVQRTRAITCSGPATPRPMAFPTIRESWT